MESQSKQLYQISGTTVEFDAEKQKRVTFYDRAGKTYRLQIFKGVRYNCFYNVRELERIEKFKMRPDDVYMTGYMRTGTNWTFEMLAMLVKQKPETVPFWKGLSQLEISPPGVLESMPSPRVIHCHMSLLSAPKEIKDLKCKVVFNLRDPRDVALSLYKMSCAALDLTSYTGEFKDFFYLFLEGKVDCDGFLTHTLRCEKFLDENPDIPVHVIWYEEALMDTVSAVKGMSDFLELPKNYELCQAIAKKCEFKQMAKDKENYSLTVDGVHFIYGKGVTGEWRKHFTEEMLEDYYRVYEDKMAGSRLYRKEYARPSCSVRPIEGNNGVSR